MNKDRLKLIVKNLELLVESLKSEVYSDEESYLHKDEYDDYQVVPIDSYDEIFNDDGGYPD